MLRTRSWVGDGNKPAAADDFGDRRGVGDGPQLDVAARREFHRGRSEPRRGVGQCRQLCGRDHAAGQPHPRQRAVCRLVHLQRAGAGVAIAGSGHQITVRRNGKTWRP